MKNILTITALVMCFTVIGSSDAIACCGGGLMQCGTAIAPETLGKFNKETKVLQEQLIDKQTLLRKEYLKDDSDPDAIANLKKNIIDIQKDIQKIAKKLGLTNNQGTCSAFQGGCYGSGCGMAMWNR